MTVFLNSTGIRVRPFICSWSSVPSSPAIRRAAVRRSRFSVYREGRWRWWLFWIGDRCAIWNVDSL